MRSRMITRLAAALTAATVLLTGCHSVDETAERPANELRLAIGGEPRDGFDPILGWGRYGSPLFHSTLVRLDANLNIVGDLATEYTVSDDGLIWSVTIRDDAAFSDGTPVTAADVAYTYTTATTSGGLVDMQALERATAVSDTQVEFELREPRSNFVYQMSTLGIVPEHLHGANAVDGSRYAQHPVGSGPFTFVQWDIGQQLIVARNENYYGDPAAFERIVFLFTDEDARVAAVRAGQVDVAGVSGSLATAIVDGYEVVAVPSVDNRGVSLPTLPARGETTAAGAPIGNDVTSELPIRQALNVAIDREALVDGILEGFGSAAQGPVDGTPWFEPASAIQSNDLPRATQILADAGWALGDDGIREKDGRRAEFSIVYPAGDAVRQGLSIAVAEQARPLGIDITVEGATWAEIAQRMHSDGVLFGFGSHDPIETFYLYDTSMGGVDFYNPGFYSSPVVDDYFHQALTAMSPEEALPFWKAAQLDEQGRGYSAQADAAWLWLVNLDHTYYVDECLDLGTPQVEPHGHGWPITAGIAEWRFRC